jgi:flavin reductase (DIM6/NTAB) family NADH-FMN oxidoreductase RutF
MMKALPLGEAYQLIEPGPVVLLVTARKGRPNVMAMSWHMMMEFAPPLIACLVSGNDYSFEALVKTKECVIAVPGADLARTVVRIGNCSGRDTDKFAKFRLATLPARRVAPPLLAGCIANLECRVADTRFVNRYNLFVLEVVQAWRDPKRRNAKTIHHRGYGRFAVDGSIITIPSRMP